MAKVVILSEIMFRLGLPNSLRLTQCNQLDMSFARAEADVVPQAHHLQKFQ